ncbi:MAG: aldehyde dehydrogenase family protein [Pseudomonadota bacterium]
MPDDNVISDQRFNGQSVSVTQAEAAVAEAARGFWTWSRTPAPERADLLDAVAQRLDDYREDIRELAAQEVGASKAWVDFNVDLAKGFLHQAIALLPKLETQTRQGRRDGTTHSIERRPAGVVLGFAPWNAPVILSVRAMATPLLCGNTVVIKTSDFCPNTHIKVVQAFQDVLPEGVAVSVTSGLEQSQEVAKFLIHHPAVRRVNFTGSTRVGRFVSEECGRAVKRSLMELSDVTPMIVLDGADIDAAVSAAIYSSFFNQGQICMSTERILVEDRVADEFADKLVAKLSSVSEKNQLGQGRLVNTAAANRLQKLVSDATSKGARLLAGGQIDGAVMEPTVLDDIGPTMRLYSEESFGPVAALIRCIDAEEAISIANDTEYGLTASVYGRPDEARAVADRLETGICQINGPSVYDDPSLPFGGVKASGFGRFGGEAALDEFTEIRWVADHSGLTAEEIDNMLYKGRT